MVWCCELYILLIVFMWPGFDLSVVFSCLKKARRRLPCEVLYVLTQNSLRRYEVQSTTLVHNVIACQSIEEKANLF